MKATTIIIAAVLTLTANVLFASNDNISVPVANAATTVSMTSLAPTVPCEADFDDASLTVDVAYLAPSNPTEASFDEMSCEMISSLNLAPINSAAADFEEETDFSSLAPVVPAEADFE
ncbi:MAG: hypothetical protein ACOYM0_05130 [Bacteroidales bacterium]